MCQLQLLSLVILLITDTHNVIYLEYFKPMSHGVNKKAPTIVSPTPPRKRFPPGLLFYK